MSNQKVIERAKLMANDRLPHHRLARFCYSIKSNPYHNTNGKGIHGKSHIDWHDAFYDECKRIGRSIY